jgi:hypothetical protein
LGFIKSTIKNLNIELNTRASAAQNNRPMFGKNVALHSLCTQHHALSCFPTFIAKFLGTILNASASAAQNNRHAKRLRGLLNARVAGRKNA